MSESRWATVSAVRTVLVVVRSPVSLNRLLDILPVFAGDPRVQLVFAVDGGSEFTGGLRSRLAGHGARLISWKDATSRSFDLALAASDNSDLHRIRAPLVLFPHGVGYQRFSAHEPGAVSGLRRSRLVRHGRVVPARIVVSHPSQRDVVGAVDHRLLSRVVVAGDPCFDRIRCSVAGRHRYSPAFGADGRRLVVLCSTWGPHSLYGRRPGLPARVVAELDADGYRTALVLHPNVWAQHGEFQLRTWLRPALDAGLVLVPPEEGWRAALVAARLVVSDHGSLTTYAVSAGAAVLLAEDGGPEVVPGSPIDLLRRRLPRLRDDVALDEQIAPADAVAADVAGTVFAEVGRSAQVLRAVLYEQLRLAPPASPVRVRPVPVPDLAVPAPTVYAVAAELGAAREERVSVTLRRVPATGHDEPDGSRPRHLAVSDAELDPGWAQRAAVVWRAGPPVPAEVARAWAKDLTERLPAVRVAVAAVREDEVLVVARERRELLASGTADAALVGSAVRCCLVGGVRLDLVRTLDITAGGTTVAVRLG